MPEAGERSPSREEELERELDKGGRELPPNEPRGLLGETNPSLYKVDDFADAPPDLNAGISQEVDMPVIWMGIVLAYLVFFPLAYVILWRTKAIPIRTKVISSVVGGVGIAALAFVLVTR